MTEGQSNQGCVQDISRADLVISHAGAGTCLEVLQAGKPLLVIVNDDLMDNHQVELAQRLSEEQYLSYGSVSTLAESLRQFQTRRGDLRPYPTPQPEIFSNFINKLMKVE